MPATYDQFGLPMHADDIGAFNRHAGALIGLAALLCVASTLVGVTVAIRRRRRRLRAFKNSNVRHDLATPTPHKIYESPSRLFSNLDFLRSLNRSSSAASLEVVGPPNASNNCGTMPRCWKPPTPPPMRLPDSDSDSIYARPMLPIEMRCRGERHLRLDATPDSGVTQGSKSSGQLIGYDGKR